MKEKLLSTREVSQILDLSEKEVIDFAQANVLPHFMVGGEFFRFRREEILKAKKSIKKKNSVKGLESKHTDSIREFLYFNDFYLISLMIIFILVWIIFKDFYI